MVRRGGLYRHTERESQVTEPTGAPMESPSAPPATGPVEPNSPATPPGQTPHDIEVARLNSGLKAMRKQYEAAQSELEKMRVASQTEQEQAVTKARAEGEAAYLNRWRASALLNAAQSRLSLKGVKSIGLAANSLNLDGIEFDPQTGAVDATALDARIDELLTQYPELAGDGRQPPAQLNGNTQQRVTADSLVSASTADKNALLRYALGR